MAAPLKPEVETEPKVGKTFWARLFDDSDYSGHRGADDLAPPPRSIPLSLFLFFMFNGRTLLFGLLPLAVFGSVGLVATDTPALDRDEIRLAAGIAVLGLLLLWLVLRWRKLGLFVRGLNQSPVLVERLTGLGGYTDSTFNHWSGWSFTPTAYTGPSYVSIVELRSPSGATARTKVRGMSYQGEQFLYDPDNPARHLRASRFGVRATPDDQGQWQIAGLVRSSVLLLLATGTFGVVVWLGIALTAGGL